MTDQPAVERRDNLFEPVPGDPGAHGPFDDRARPSAPSFYLDRHRRVVAAAAATVAGLGAVALLRR